MKYNIFKDNQQIGPMEESEVEARLRDNTYTVDDLACREGDTGWKPLSDYFPTFADSSHSWMGDSGNLPPTADPYQGQGGQNRPQATYEPPQQQNPWPDQQAAPVQHVIHHHAEGPESPLPKIAMIAGIVVASLMVVGLVPCLGMLNYVVIIGGFVTVILSLIAIFSAKNSEDRNKALIGLVLAVIAMIVGFIRLILGGGCL